MGKLTAKTVQKIIREGTPGLTNDGDGLYLKVGKSLGASWIYRFKIAGRSRDMGLGSYPAVSLAEAREAVAENRKKVKVGIDPVDERRRFAGNLILSEPIIPNFTQCAARYIRSHRRGWRNKKHARQWVSTLKTYAVPLIGNKPVDSIDTQDIVAVLTPIWHLKTETAKRVQGRIENVLDYAIVHEYRSTANAARWRGHLDKLLAKPSRIQQVAHHPAMPYNDVPRFLALLGQNQYMSSKALQLLIHTATRTSEVLHATWSEFDIEKRVWTIPAERMKARREHRVPLTDQVIANLKGLPRHADNPYVFPGARYGRPLSNMAMLQLMRGLDIGVGGQEGNYVPHGFRSSFRDWSGEVTSFPRDVAEMALAHTIQNKVEAAYRRGDLFEKRREMMQSWSDFITAS